MRRDRRVGGKKLIVAFNRGMGLFVRERIVVGHAGASRIRAMASRAVISPARNR